MDGERKKGREWTPRNPRCARSDTRCQGPDARRRDDEERKERHTRTPHTRRQSDSKKTCDDSDNADAKACPSLSLSPSDTRVRAHDSTFAVAFLLPSLDSDQHDNTTTTTSRASQSDRQTNTHTHVLSMCVFPRHTCFSVADITHTSPLEYEFREIVCEEARDTRPRIKNRGRDVREEREVTVNVQTRPNVCERRSFRKSFLLFRPFSSLSPLSLSACILAGQRRGREGEFLLGTSIPAAAVKRLLRPVQRRRR